MENVYSYDDSKLDDQIQSVESNNLKDCVLCGKKFIKKGRFQVCPRVHYRECIVCGKTFVPDLSVGFKYIKSTCSTECANKQRMQKMQDTLMETHGVTNPGQLKDHQDKVRATCKERYGVENYSQSDDFRSKVRESWASKTPEELQARLDKSVETNLSRYGVPNGAMSDQAKQKQISTNRERYGADWYRQTEACESRIRETNKERYGDEVFFRTQHYKDKVHESSLRNHGVDHFTQSEEYKEHMKESMLNKYGVSCVLQLDKAKEHLVKSNQDNYGVDYLLSSEEIQDRCKRSMQEQYGVDYGFQSDEIQKLADEGMIQKYGCPNPGQVEEIRQRIIQTSKSEERRLKFESTVMSHYGVTNPMQSRDLVIRQTQSAKSNETCDGTRVDSSYEALVYNFCVRNNLNFETQVPIEYEYSGKYHVTYIDFKIEGILFEVKGGHLLSGCFDYEPKNVPIDVKLNLYRRNHVVVITDDFMKLKFGKPNSSESNGLKYLHKCPEPLIGIDISLFREDPKFPYRSDRPPVFYQVKVNGQKSVYEAFYDEKIRWKMILNRINYSGGFIDSTQILTAMNVSRTCKQPSWFAKSFAKRILETYATSNTIVDPFAGWGTRYDAAKELGLKYIGCDLNEELVHWHKLKSRDIKFDDATSFKYEGKCSVFICPPYQDIEVYFDDQNCILTQCQWLEIVMKNVPNASEYIMVCKIVDSGWEKYIAERKDNKSHFGDNFEYVLVVPNNAIEYLS